MADQTRLLAQETPSEEPRPFSLRHRIFGNFRIVATPLKNMFFALCRIYGILSLFYTCYTLTCWTYGEGDYRMADGETLRSDTVLHLTAINVDKVSEWSKNGNGILSVGVSPATSIRPKKPKSAFLFPAYLTTPGAFGTALKAPMISVVMTVDAANACNPNWKPDFNRTFTEEQINAVTAQEEEMKRKFDENRNKYTANLVTGRLRQFSFLSSFLPQEGPPQVLKSRGSPGKMKWTALVHHGGCSFERIVSNMESAGFEGAFIYNDIKTNNLGEVDIRMLPQTDAKDIHIFSSFLVASNVNHLKAYSPPQDMLMLVATPIELSYLPRERSFYGISKNLLQLFLFVMGTSSFFLSICTFLIVVRNKVFENDWMLVETLEAQVDLLTGDIFAADLDLEHYLAKPPPTLNSIPFPLREIVASDLDSQQVQVSWAEGGCGSNDKCAICLDEFAVGDKVRDLTCRHMFHSTCVDEWLLRCHRVCPICKRDVLEPMDVKKKEVEVPPPGILRRSRDAFGRFRDLSTLWIVGRWTNWRASFIPLPHQR